MDDLEALERNSERARMTAWLEDNLVTKLSTCLDMEMCISDLNRGCLPEDLQEAYEELAVARRKKEEARAALRGACYHPEPKWMAALYRELRPLTKQLLYGDEYSDEAAERSWAIRMELLRGYANLGARKEMR